MKMPLHALAQYEFHAAMFRHVSQPVALAEAAALVLVQHLELSTVAASRLVAIMRSNEPFDIKDTAEPISGSPDTDV